MLTREEALELVAGGVVVLLLVELRIDAHLPADILHQALGIIRIVDEKGRVLEGDLSNSEKAGLAQFEQILKTYGKINKDITWNWENKY